MKLIDPGKGLPQQAAQQARIALWKRPADVKARRQATEERKKDWEGYSK